MVVGRRRSALQGLHLHGQEQPARGPPHHQQSMIVIPRDTPGVSDQAAAQRVWLRSRASRSRGRIEFKDVRVPKGNLTPRRGSWPSRSRRPALAPDGFTIACDPIGTAERSPEIMCKRVQTRVAFGQRLSGHGDHSPDDIAKSRVEIEQGRLLVHASRVRDGQTLRQQASSPGDCDDQGHGPRTWHFACSTAPFRRTAPWASVRTFLSPRPGRISVPCALPTDPMRSTSIRSLASS